MYDRDDVTTYLPGVFDPSLMANPPRKPAKSSVDPKRWRQVEPLKGGRLTRACKPEQRKGTIDPRTANSGWVEILDMDRAFKRAGLTHREKQAMYLVYGMRMPQRDAGQELGVGQPVISRRIENATIKILAFLNGGGDYDIEEETP